MSTDDFFRARLETMIDLRHPLAVLAQRMPWREIEAAIAPLLVHKDRAGKPIEGADLFGPTLAVAGAPKFDTFRPVFVDPGCQHEWNQGLASAALKVL